MNLTISKNANPNYLAKIARIDSFKPHPNADRMKLATVDGFVISVGIDTEPGIFIYFPTECEIHHDYLHCNNLYRVTSEGNLNRDTTCKGGYFEKNRRVRCVRLRDFDSEGFVMPISSLLPLMDLPKNIDALVGTEFDVINDYQFVKKYIPKHSRTPGQPGTGGKNRKKERKYEDVIVEEQFRFHDDTAQLKKNLHKFNPETLIHISDKWHGTSAIYCNLLVKKKLSIFEKFLKLIKVNIVDTKYQIFSASRKVIKDPELNKSLGSGFYGDVDIWGITLELIRPHLKKGMTIYAEVVGYLPNGGMLQKEYDYGCEYFPKIYDYNKMTPQQMLDANLFKIVVYRITQTNVDGVVTEMSAVNLRQYCERIGLMPVREIFYGTVDSYLCNRETEWESFESMREAFLKHLTDDYLEMNCLYCYNKVPREGVVLRVDQPNFEAYKLKSLAFLRKETENLDKGVIDMETQEGEDNEE